MESVEFPLAPIGTPVALLSGKISYDRDALQHVIKGTWNFDANRLISQKIILMRKLNEREDPTELPKDGKFHGLFRCNHSGKNKIIEEDDVRIQFTKVVDRKKNQEFYQIAGTGKNIFGSFRLHGKAVKSRHGKSDTYVKIQKHCDLLSSSSPLQDGGRSRLQTPRPTPLLPPKETKRDWMTSRLTTRVAYSWMLAMIQRN